MSSVDPMPTELSNTIRTIRQNTIGDLLRRASFRDPDTIAICHRDITWTYRELEEVCNRLAAGLIDLGVRPGDRVAILSRNSHAFVALRYAVARIGGVLVPINFMLNANEVRFI